MQTHMKMLHAVIPVKTGIQTFQAITQTLDTRVRGYDGVSPNRQI